MMITTNGEHKMLNDLDEANSQLSYLAEQGIIEPMVEPIDEPDCHPMDWAEVTGLAEILVEDIYPEIVEA
jgi:hypothetical protein